MSFRDREKKRLVPLKPELFSAEACEPGNYNKVPRDFCLRDDRSSENLHCTICDEAIAYFLERGIPWHDGMTVNRKKDRPSNHLCCSQSACVNFWFPYVRCPEKLAGVLRGLGYDVAEVLPFKRDAPLPDGAQPYVAFEWIGERNYLMETSGGRVADDDSRTRGANFTSLDFAIRFRQCDGAIHIIAGEWKYSENYANNKNIRYAKSGTDRLEIYGPSFEMPDCQVELQGVAPEALFFDPFDQLMRQQLLASAMERETEMGAKIVSLLHVAPRINAELMNRITSPALQSLGDDIHAVWAQLVRNKRFKGCYTGELLQHVIANAPDIEWADYMKLRYGDMT
jgi:hypothetical protein